MNIKDIVEQVQETPSPHCWESIASQLPAAGTAIGGGTAATVAKGAMSAGKLAAIIGSTVAVVAVATIITISTMNNEIETVQQTNNQQNTLVVTDSDTTDTTPMLCQAEEEQNIADKEETNTPSTIVPVSEENITDDAIPAVQSTPINNAPILNTNTIPSSTPITSQANSTSTSDNSSTNNSTPVPNTTSPAKQNNQDHNEETTLSGEEWDASQPIIIEIPNIFTPNGDGFNDFFVINGLENCEKKMLLVKDRSGQIVFQSRNYDNSWNGENLPDGTYYYQFSYSINNINELRQGAILIKR